MQVPGPNLQARRTEFPRLGGLTDMVYVDWLPCSDFGMEFLRRHLDLAGMIANSGYQRVPQIKFKSDVTFFVLRL